MHQQHSSSEINRDILENLFTTVSLVRDPYIFFEDVSVSYSDLVQGLKNINLKIEQGEFVFFAGHTGAGKSTILKLLTREVRQTSGRIKFNGFELNPKSRISISKLRREMGIVPQDYALLPNKRVWENIGYAMRAAGKTRKEVRKEIPDILEQVNIAYRADAYPHQLSGGEQQRVAVGRALVNQPSLLLADEPTANLDPANAQDIMELLLKLNRQGTTILVSTHDQAVLEKMKKRIITLHYGEIISDYAISSR